jgi:hypothetical protein
MAARCRSVETKGGRAAILQWIADGGQVYPPKQGCTIEVTSLHGSNRRRIRGHDFGMHAGIDRQLSSVKFAMHGVSSR